MTQDSEASRWERLARDPYYAVLNEEQNRGVVRGERRAAFFASGARDVETTLRAIRRWIDPSFHPRLAVDYGCGVGRLTIPLAGSCEHVIGLDIAPRMLAEAAANCAAAGVTNVSFATPADFFAAAGPCAGVDRVDFVHSFIVLQHVPVAAGEAILASLLERLRSGGVGALHFTYAREAPVWRKVVNRLRGVVPGVNAAVNLAQGRAASEPRMPMYNYDLGRLVDRLAGHGCHEIHLLPTDHGGHHGAMLIFRQNTEADAQRPYEH
jgi:SAM-dependent methyltransferase